MSGDFNGMQQLGDGALVGGFKLGLAVAMVRNIQKHVQRLLMQLERHLLTKQPCHVCKA